ncbi:MAG: tyrosine-type recombinase/integrase [Bacillota bacterium]
MAKRKAANGEGTVFFRKRDRKWVCEIIVGRDPTTGKKQVIRFAHERKAEVSAWRVQKLAELRQGNLVAKPSEQTVQEFMEHWISTTLVHEVKPSTVNLYREMLRYYIGPGLGKVPLAKLTPQMVAAFYHKLMSDGLSPRSTQIVHACLRRALQQAVDWQLIPKNPVAAVKKPRSEQKEFTALTPEQVKRFLDAARESRLHALFTLAVLTGMRLGELLGLRWQDVDLDKGTITVAQILERVGSSFRFNSPKTKASRRTFELPAACIQALRRWRREQAEERMRVGPAWAHPELVFTTTLGTPLSHWNVTKRDFRAVLEKAGLPRIRFHDLRHTAATLMLDQGVPVHVVSRVLGHASVTVTLQVYAHVLEQKKKEAARAIDEFLAAHGE